MKLKSKPMRGTMNPGKGKTWTDKLNSGKLHQVKLLDKDFADIPEGCKMLIATPKIIDEYIKRIPEGKTVSLQKMRKDLAWEYRAEHTCPVTSGIFLRIVSEAAYEQIAQGTPLNEITPFWRMVEEDSAINKKLSFGSEFVSERRKEEGIGVMSHGQVS